MTISKMSFSIGRLVQTIGIVQATSKNSKFYLFLMNCITRHKSNDWGDCCEEDWKNNDAAVIVGERILSVYNLPEDFKSLGQNSRDNRIWIITEWNRTNSTVLFPSEY